MSSKFGSLVADTEVPFRKFLDDPANGRPIADKNGKRAYIDVLPNGGAAAKLFDKEQREKEAQEAAAGNLSDADAGDRNVTREKLKTARLTRGWYLVDPDTREHLDVECTEENARELYLSSSLMAIGLWAQAYGALNLTPNFIKRSAALSSATPSTSSGKTESSEMAQP